MSMAAERAAARNLVFKLNIEVRPQAVGLGTVFDRDIIKVGTRNPFTYECKA